MTVSANRDCTEVADWRVVPAWSDTLETTGFNSPYPDSSIAVLFVVLASTKFDEKTVPVLLGLVLFRA